MSAEPATVLVPEAEPEKRNIAPWIQLPRRLVYLFLAYGAARLLLWLLPRFVPARFPGRIDSQAAGALVSERLSTTLFLWAGALGLALVLALLPFIIGVLADWLEKNAGLPGSIVKGLGRLVVFPTGALPVVVLGGLFLLLTLRLEIGLNESAPVMAVITLALYPAMILAQATTRVFTLPWPVTTGRRIGGAALFAGGALLAQTAGMLSAGVVVEVIFNRPGLGRLLYESMIRLDLGVTFAALAAFLFLVLAGRFVAEIFRAGTRLVWGDLPLVETRPSPWRRRARLIWVAVALVLLLLPAGIATVGLITPEERTVEQELGSRNAPPSSEHLFGTDELGRDLWARTMKGAWRLLLYSGMVAVGAVLLAAPLGILGGYIAGKRTWPAETVSDTILLLFDGWLIYPLIPLVLILAVVFTLEQAELRSALVVVLLVVGLLPRTMRAARRMWTAGPAQLHWGARLGLLILALFLSVLFTSFTVLLAIDYLGFFTAPPAASLGLILQNAGRFLFTNTGSVAYPWLVIALITFPLYLAADAFIGFFDTKEVAVRLNE